VMGNFEAALKEKDGDPFDCIPKKKINKAKFKNNVFLASPK